MSGGMIRRAWCSFIAMHAALNRYLFCAGACFDCCCIQKWVLYTDGVHDELG